MGQVADYPAGLPEFFATDAKVQMMPGRCVRVVYIHPTEGESHAVIMPWTCWVDMRMKCEAFQRAYIEEQSVVRLPH